jgi:hypothetical protein
LRSVDTTTHLYFASTILVGAVLLFSCQPMVARMIVPLLGDAPAVWIVCSLCFQTLLLGGYAYAHFVGTRLPVRVQVGLQLVLVAAVFGVMPVAVGEATVERFTAGHPTLGLLVVLLKAIGLPFFVLSTSSPLLQRWFAELGERDPYHLYAASNAGSMLALFGYPLVIEPLLSVKQQSRALHTAFAAYSILVVVCAIGALRRPSPLRIDTTPAPPQVRVSQSAIVAAPRVETAAERWLERLVWIALSFAPSSLLLGATEYVTSEIASVPLLWALPLALYLLSFVFAFARKQVSPSLWSRALAIAAAVVVAITLADHHGPAWVVLAAHMVLLFFASVVCHRGLAQRRPHVSRLTEFYLLLSVGGVLGAVFNGLIAPLLFHDLFEYPIAIALACLGRALILPKPPTGQASRRIFGSIAFSMAAFALLLLGMSRRGSLGTTVWANRGLFGVVKVVRDPDRRFQLLVSGGALHGKQALDPAAAQIPLAHYHPTGPAGDVLGPLGSEGARLPPRHVGVIGLGVGSLAAYARPGDEWTFYERNPAVADVASRYFTYLETAKKSASVRVDVGDARLLLRDGPKARFDVLVVDAFSSDAVPVHLVTREALQVYRDALRPGGLLLVHVTNDHVRLLPVFAALAREAGMNAMARRDPMPSPEMAAVGKSRSDWVVLTDSRAEIDPLLRAAKDWRPLTNEARVPVWTDDYANVLAALRF